MPLYTFYQIFRVVDSNTLAFIYPTKVGSTLFAANDTIRRGQIIAGIDFFKFLGSNMEISEADDGVRVVERVYV